MENAVVIGVALASITSYSAFMHFLHCLRVSKMTERLRETPCLLLGKFFTSHVSHAC